MVAWVVRELDSIEEHAGSIPSQIIFMEIFCVIARISTLIFPQFETFCNSDDEFEKIVLGPLKF